MLLNGLCHNLDGDCEISTHDLHSQQHASTEQVDDHLEPSDDCSVAYEDKMKSIIFFAKECEEVESRSTLSDTASLMGNQLLQHDHSYEATLARVTTAYSSQYGKKKKRSLGEGTGENLDGFQSPTKDTDLILSASLKCPPAPRKPKAKQHTKRKREEYMNFQPEFVNEVESVLRLLNSEDDKILKRARISATGETNGGSMKSCSA